jgi:hypothetical protein
MLCCRIIATVGKKPALDDNSLVPSQDIVYRLEPQVGHSDPIVIWIGKMEANISGAVVVRHNIAFESF